MMHMFISPTIQMSVSKLKVKCMKTLHWSVFLVLLLQWPLPQKIRMSQYLVIQVECCMATGADTLYTFCTFVPLLLPSSCHQCYYDIRQRVKQTKKLHGAVSHTPLPWNKSVSCFVEGVTVQVSCLYRYVQVETTKYEWIKKCAATFMNTWL